MKYKTNWDGGVFAVPDSAADCLKLASGKAVKVLLYMLKNKISDVDLSAFAEIGVSEEDAEDALSYWQQVGVLFTGDSAPETVIVKNDEKAIPQTAPADTAAQRAKERSSKMISPEEIADRVKASEDIKFLFDSAEVSFGKILNYTEQRTVIWLHDYYGIASDLLLMIMDFSRQMNKASIGFVEKIAISWHDNDISTHEQASREIQRLKNYYSAEGQVVSQLGLNRTLTPTEKKLVKEWSDKGISIELILYAYEKTVDNIGKVKFSYMNKILTGWQESGISTVTDAKAAAKSPKKDTAESGSGEHSYNLELLVAHAMNNTPKIKK